MCSDALDLAVHPLGRVCEHGITAQVTQRAVELNIQRVECGLIIVGDARSHRLEHEASAVVAMRSQQHCFPDGRALKQLPHVIQIPSGDEVKGRHRRAAVGTDQDESLTFQSAERLSDGSRGNAEDCGQSGLAESEARLQFAIGNRTLQCDIHAGTQTSHMLQWR
jgi:hypothetical protein